MTLTALLTLLTLGGSILIIALLLYGLRKVLDKPLWTEPERSRIFNLAAAILIGWFLIASYTAWIGVYEARGATPTIQYPLLIPILVGALMIWRSPTVTRLLDATPQHWLIGIQVFRVLGGTFLVLYALEKMPGVFAWPAGIGDILVGALAPVVALAYARDPRDDGDLVTWWNILGITDLVVAVGTGISSSPSLIQMTAFDRPNELISAFPLVLVPAFLVPLWILLHIASLTKLRRTEARERAGGGVAISSM